MQRKGFSLVELSIVLVILGLLTGGILAGQSLIRASELRAVSTEYQRYLAAVQTFRDKYFAVPGDFSQATKFWGTDPDGCPGTNAAITYSANTCDGDGNGLVQETATNSNELYRFWQHLANAGLIEGNYSGVTNSPTATDVMSLVGINSPRSKLNNAGWTASYVQNMTVASTSWFEGNYGNIFIFGANSPATWTSGVILKPEEAWNIDTKMDDGRPGQGFVLVTENRTTCHDAGTSAATALAGTANYALTQTGANCHMVFRSQF
jgi:prepilin-type N-terminal cleavage/methylation domain-containing protein